MTKIIVQLCVENLLKMLKVLKTRTALKRNRLAELRMRYARQGAKAPSKQGSANLVTKLLQSTKIIEKLLTYDKIESEKERS